MTVRHFKAWTTHVGWNDCLDVSDRNDSKQESLQLQSTRVYKMKMLQTVDTKVIRKLRRGETNARRIYSLEKVCKHPKLHAVATAICAPLTSRLISGSNGRGVGETASASRSALSAAWSSACSSDSSL